MAPLSSPPRLVMPPAALLLLAALCLIAPLWIGGALLSFTPAAAFLLALAWARLPRLPAVHGDAAATVLLLLLAWPALVIAAQLVPLPRSLLAWLSPHALALRDQAPAPLTLDVPESQWALLQDLTLLLLGALLLRLQPPRPARRLLLDAIVLAALAQVAVAALHAAFHNSRSVLWLYPLPAGWDSGLGTFVNRNHAASLLVLALAISAGAAMERPHPWRYRLALLPLLAGLWASGSRAALGATLLGLLLLPAVVPAASPGRRGWRSFLLSLLAASLVLFAALRLSPAWASRLRPLLDGTIRHYQKVRVWHDCLPLIRDFARTGVGAGAFQSAFPAYRTGDEYVTVPYPASLPLQHATSYGVPAAAVLWLLAAALAALLWRRRQRLLPSERGAALGALLVAVHCLAEYSLELLGVGIPTLVALGCAVHASRDRRALVTAPAPVAWQAGALAALCLLLGSDAVLLRPHLLAVERLRIRQALLAGDPAQAEALFVKAQPRHPCDHPLAALGTAAALQGNAPLGEVLRRANQVLRLHPADVDAHRAAAMALRRAGRVDQAAFELQQAFAQGWPPDPTNLRQADALVGAQRLIDVLRPHPSELRGLAAYLASRGHADLAEQARQRAAALDQPTR